MNRPIEQLLHALQQTEALYLQLLLYIDQEKRAAAGAEVQDLMAASNEKQAVILQLKSLDQQVVGLMNQIAREKKIPKNRISFSSLAEDVPAPFDGRIRDMNLRLKTVISKVQTANEECRQLMVHCLRLVKNKLGFLGHWMGYSADVYAASGNIRGAANGGRVIRDLA
ncbi:MAG: flagellar export chaperone FlgN [Desulfobacteraceae bacterium]|nr:flagellar export chaperone FlgN [Desulfobacteraceae bacterium]